MYSLNLVTELFRPTDGVKGVGMEEPNIPKSVKFEVSGRELGHRSWCTDPGEI